MSCIKGVSHSVGARKYLPHSHDNEHRLIYVKRGRVKLRVSAKEWVITRPSVIFISNLEKHSLVSESDNYERYSVAFLPTEAMRKIDSDKLMSPFCDRPSGFSNVADVSQITDELNMLFEMLLCEYKEEDKNIGDACDAVLRVILLKLLRHIPDSFPYKSTERSAIVQEVRRMLETDLHKELSLDDVSAAFHISTYYLSHIFKEVTGYSVKNYRLLCRLANARELLVTTEHTIKEICEMTGFPDMSNFSRRFKYEYGVTPTEYRKTTGSLFAEPEK
ncbi:MAG: helix-turn-helix transcriptional regulator [Clostridia bacterium]|nr:helix-turn-helix transcriptional regulator [Clostridia bacterium]